MALDLARHRAVDALKTITPLSIRRALVRSRLKTRQLTARWRDLPDFLILGCQRGGTSSLYKYLGRHPHILPTLRKETEYFSARYPEGEDWYRAHFPLHGRVALGEMSGSRRLVFEATPDYLLDPRAPRRARGLLPHARLIVLLREPRQRAFSHFRHNVRLGLETEPLERALSLEEERIARDVERLEDDPNHSLRTFRRYSYVARGQYAEQVRRWLDVYPIDRFLFLESEQFFAQPAQVLKQILQFVGAEEWSPPEFRNYSYLEPGAVNHMALPLEAVDLLEGKFTASNEALRAMLPGKFRWLEPEK